MNTLKRRAVPLLVLALLLGLAALAVSAYRNRDAAPYVASSQREPFHRRSCEWAAKIAGYNLVEFRSRQEAIDAGHRPCRVCRP